MQSSLPTSPRAPRGRMDPRLSKAFPAIVQSWAGSGSCDPQAGPGGAAVGSGASWLRGWLASSGPGWRSVAPILIPQTWGDPLTWCLLRSCGQNCWTGERPCPGKGTGTLSHGHTRLQVGNAEHPQNRDGVLMENAQRVRDTRLGSPGTALILEQGGETVSRGQLRAWLRVAWILIPAPPWSDDLEGHLPL